MAKRSKPLSQFGYIRLVHSLFSADLLNRVLTGAQAKCGKNPMDFCLKPGLTVSDEIARAWRIAASSYSLAEGKKMQGEKQMEYIRSLLTGALEYQYFVCPECGILPDTRAENADMLPGMADALTSSDPEELFPITALISLHSDVPGIPLLVVPGNQELDKLYNFPDGRRKTPFLLMQEYLDRSDRFLWAIVTNGSDWRIMRDSTTIALRTYLDVDLGSVLALRDREAFASIYRLMHASRIHRSDPADPASCLWECWRKELEQGGERVRDGLSARVQAAICSLGTGFLSHRANESLRAAVESKELQAKGLYNELLHLIYRFIFLFVTEERNLLHAHCPRAVREKEVYEKGYSMARLVARAQQTHHQDKYDDLWQSVKIVFSALSSDSGEPRLALPALGGLFDTEQCPHLDISELSNATLLEAMQLLRWSHNVQDGALLRIDYRNMGTEELGAVYESLLELSPCIEKETRRFCLRKPDIIGTSGEQNARKQTSSFYTPPVIVEQIVRMTVDSHINKIRSENASESGKSLSERLLATRILDPSCGSGHFLLSAARHLAQAVAEASSAEPEKYMSTAMHEVISRCTYGVDLNPMAIELVRMNLWLDGYLPNKPLSFLDAHLVCGNSLLGLADWETLTSGIPAGAYAPRKSDHKATCSFFRKANDRALKAQEHSPMRLNLSPLVEPSAVPKGEETPSSNREKQRAWKQHIARFSETPLATAADVYVGTAIMPKTQGANVPTSERIYALLCGGSSVDEVIEAAVSNCRQQSVVHWPLYFPEIMNQGGFDIIIGNPPYYQLEKDGGHLADLYQNCGYQSFKRSADIYCLFYERGLSLLRDRGQLCFITSNKWMRADYGEPLRGFLAHHSNPKALMDFGGVKIFAGATVDTNILHLEKAPNEGRTIGIRVTKEHADRVDNLSVLLQQGAASCSFTSEESWIILSPVEMSIKRKIEALGIPLRKWEIQINYGIKTGYNEAFIITTEKRDEILSRCMPEERIRTEALIRPKRGGQQLPRPPLRTEI